MRTRWRRGEIELIVSPALLGEVERVPNRPMFRPYATVEEAAEYLAKIRREAIVQPDPPNPPRVCRDPYDDYLIALARSARARYLVSGDRDLTEIPGAVPPVLKPREFVAALDLGRSE